jgi:hypothetical protein
MFAVFYFVIHLLIRKRKKPSKQRFIAEDFTSDVKSFLTRFLWFYTS